jgi:hypothetical protein
VLQKEIEKAKNDMIGIMKQIVVHNLVSGEDKDNAISEV